jgi:pimeloyl-ACP methyl ester carboxylesterase
VDRIAEVPALRLGVLRLKLLGYEDIVLLGHSAGGIIVRQFAEDHPDAGVTKVIQVCAPNGGSLFAKLNLVAPSQRPFVASLTEAARQQTAQERGGKLLPKQVQCLCVVGFGTGSGDGVVACKCQWPEDLQAQGVPVARLKVLHWVVMASADSAKSLAGYVCQDHPRWSEDEVASARMLFRLRQGRE